MYYFLNESHLFIVNKLFVMADLKNEKTGILLPHTHIPFLLCPFSFLNCARILKYVLGLLLLALL